MSLRSTRPSAGWHDTTSPVDVKSRIDWWKALWWGIVGLFIAAGVVGFVLGIISIINYQFLSQTVLQNNGQLPSSSMNMVLAGGTALAMTLPNDLSPYVGYMYNVDCASAAAHSVTIQVGPLTTYWSPPHRTATCSAATPGTGFTFRVIAPNLIRVVASNGVTFS